jgi:hypothetical protein
MKLGREVAGLTAGIDQLFRSKQQGAGFLDVEGLIPVAVANVEPRPLRDYQEATDALLALLARLPAEAESALRRAYLAEMIDSLLALVATFQAPGLPFAERVRRQIRVDTQMVDGETLAGYRAIIQEQLAALGYGGDDLAADVARWEADARVAPGDLLATMRALTEEARTRTAAMLSQLGKLENEWLEPVEIRNVPFSAYCDYPGRKLLLNLDYPYTTWALKHLACHEAFPGHLVHLHRREQLVAAGMMALDGAQVVTSSASSALFEGIADNGLYFLNWVQSPEDEAAIALRRLRGALRCNAAWMIHAEGRPIAEVAGIVAGAGFEADATVASRLAFVRHDLRAPFVYAYWCGDMAVHAVWQRVPANRRAEFFAYLYDNMHTPSTLRDFWPDTTERQQ